MHNIISPLVYSLLTLALVCGDASAANAPAAVTRLAETYVASHPDATQSPASPTREETYARYFFIGLTSQNGGIWNAPELETAAYYQGQSYWREHPGERDEILAGYGYAHVEVDGTWARGFESSSFTPADQATEHWWATSFGGVAWRDLRPGQPDPAFHKAHVHIVGYLSPIGGHGHLGMYHREVLVTSFTLLDGPHGAGEQSID